MFLRHFSGKALINFVLRVVQYILPLSFKATKLVSERFCFVYTQSSHEKVPGCLSFVLAITQFYTVCIGTCMMQELFKIAKNISFVFLAEIKKTVFKERLSSATSRLEGLLPSKPPDLSAMRKSNTQSAKASKKRVCLVKM